MKNLFLTILCFCSWNLSAQDFYDLETIQTIEITFSQSNWDQILDAAKASTEDYTLATTVTINGEVFDSVGVKYKGQRSFLFTRGFVLSNFTTIHGGTAF